MPEQDQSELNGQIVKHQQESAALKSHISSTYSTMKGIQTRLQHLQAAEAQKKDGVDLSPIIADTQKLILSLEAAHPPVKTDPPASEPTALPNGAGTTGDLTGDGTVPIDDDTNTSNLTGAGTDYGTGGIGSGSSD